MLKLTYFVDPSSEKVSAEAGDSKEEMEGETAVEKPATEVEKTEVGASSGGVSVHVEALVESLELVLYSHVGGVAEVKIKGTKYLLFLQTIMFSFV